jgi:hypothetical protein
MKPQGHRRMTRFLQPRHPKLKATSEQRGIVEGIHLIFGTRGSVLTKKGYPISSTGRLKGNQFA